jgi:hypothetical protein
VNLRVFNEDSTTGIADGVLYRFNEGYDNSVDGQDVEKLSNLYENLSIVSDTALLTVERRQLPVAGDTLPLSLSGTKTTSYQLEIIAQPAVSASLFLYDRYLKQLSPISTSDTNRFTISINSGDALSRAANRFSIVVQPPVQVLPVSFSAVRAYAKANTVVVEWRVAGEADVQGYEIEKSTNGINFTKAGELKASGAVNYRFNDAMPFEGNSYYRIKSVDQSGKATYSRILPVTIEDNSNAGGLSVYPNPITGKSFQVQLSNKAAGSYILELVSRSGQHLFTQSINYKGGTATFNVQLKNALVSGLYIIRVTVADGTATITKIIVP